VAFLSPPDILMLEKSSSAIIKDFVSKEDSLRNFKATENKDKIATATKAKSPIAIVTSTKENALILDLILSLELSLALILLFIILIRHKKRINLSYYFMRLKLSHSILICLCLLLSLSLSGCMFYLKSAGHEDVDLVILEEYHLDGIVLGMKNYSITKNTILGDALSVICPLDMAIMRGEDQISLGSKELLERFIMIMGFRLATYYPNRMEKEDIKLSAFHILGITISILFILNLFQVALNSHIYNLNK
jgi:hypothetical protein